jgi:mono/diheme cytochrome c family protein
MDVQPSMGVYEPYGPPPDGTVPYGEKVSRPGSLEEARLIANPVEPDEASIRAGRFLFGTYCAVCHGADANGTGTVSAKFIPAPDITSDYYRGLPDGHFYFIVKHGSAVMPSYREALGERDIWNIVNYVRELQKGD